MSKTWTIRTLLFGLLTSVATPCIAVDPAHAENAPPPQSAKGHGKSKGKGKEGAEARRKQRLEAQAKRLEESAKRLQAEGKTDEAKKLSSRAAKLRKAAAGQAPRGGNAKAEAAARKSRKYQKLKALRRKYGKGLDDPGVQAELSLHAERRAKLRRMKELAEAGNKPEVTERVQKLTAAEDQRHQAELSKLLGKDKPAATETPSAEDSQ